MMKKEKSHGIQLLLRCVVRDPDGKIITDTGTKPAKSFLIQFLEFIYGMARDSATDGTDVNNAESTLYAPGFEPDEQFDANAPVNEDKHGPVVGTGDTAETNVDYKLETQLTEGTGVGNITHGATTVGSAGEVGANVDVEIKRAFINNTGAAIGVKEAGIYIAMTYAAPFDNEWCIVRDVLPATVNVPDRCSLAIYYTLRTTV